MPTSAKGDIECTPSQPESLGDSADDVLGRQLPRKESEDDVKTQETCLGRRVLTGLDDLLPEIRVLVDYGNAGHVHISAARLQVFQLNEGSAGSGEAVLHHLARDHGVVQVVLWFASMY